MRSSEARIQVSMGVTNNTSQYFTNVPESVNILLAYQRVALFVERGGKSLANPSRLSLHDCLVNSICSFVGKFNCL